MVFLGKKALVTGSTGGLGSRIAASLLDSGCKVFFLGKNEARLLEMHKDAGALKSLGYLSLDFSDYASMEHAIENILKPLEFDILINSAGVFPVSSIHSSSADQFDHCFDVNVRAPFLLSQAVATTMCKKGWGRIVNIGSSSAYAGFKNTSIYCASKHALLGISRSLFYELKEHKVRVISVSPGSVQTEMGKKVVGQDFETFINPEDAANVIMHLMSYDAEMVVDEVRLNRMITQ